MSRLPDFYNPENVGKLYAPRTPQVISQGRADNLPHAHRDEQRVMLLLVDPQVDFVHEDGSLSVPGAVDDTRRTIEWMFRHITEMTSIAASLDSHIPTQIFYSTWWTNEADQHPAPFTPITSADVDQQRWQPVFERQWSCSYVHTLEEQRQKGTDDLAVPHDDRHAGTHYHPGAIRSDCLPLCRPAVSAYLFTQRLDPQDRALLPVGAGSQSAGSSAGQI